MAEESDEEKTEEPTPQKLEKAREEGQVPRSRELTTFMLLVTGVAGLWTMGGWTGAALSDVMRTSMRFDPAMAMDTSRLLNHLWALALLGLKALAPMLLALFVVAGVAPTLLGGWLFSAKSLKVDPNRLNLFKGIGKLFSAQALIELLKAIAKSVLVGAVAAAFFYLHLGEIIGLAREQGDGALLHALNLVAACCAFMVAAFLVVVLIDVPFQLWSHHKKLRMSRDEIKKENKESEGDPQLKSRIRQQQQEMARKRMMSEVPKADVVITNPTHFAVALAYREDEMSAPRVVAKGADHVAAKIRELAQAHEVARLEAPPLARALYRHADIDQEIPAALYTAVAEVLAWVFRLQQARRSGEAPPARPRDIDVPDVFDGQESR